MRQRLVDELARLQQSVAVRRQLLVLLDNALLVSLDSPGQVYRHVLQVPEAFAPASLSGCRLVVLIFTPVHGLPGGRGMHNTLARSCTLGARQMRVDDLSIVLDSMRVLIHILFIRAVVVARTQVVITSLHPETRHLLAGGTLGVTVCVSSTAHGAHDLMQSLLAPFCLRRREESPLDQNAPRPVGGHLGDGVLAGASRLRHVSRGRLLLEPVEHLVEVCLL
mmetsp:Transcript_8028/g.12732  ORF Transcript_8028/g.12732 Transcript_8028/m.12732 type:complete len:222 (+) Transcript_8028:1320-1985(+)